MIKTFFQDTQPVDEKINEINSSLDHEILLVKGRLRDGIKELRLEAEEEVQILKAKAEEDKKSAMKEAESRSFTQSFGENILGVFRGRNKYIS